jgi:phosphoribosylpyrophosphate synthetase
LIKGHDVNESVQTIYEDGSKEVTIHVSHELFEDPAPKHIKKLYLELSYAWF